MRYPLRLLSFLGIRLATPPPIIRILTPTYNPQRLFNHVMLYKGWYEVESELPTSFTSFNRLLEKVKIQRALLSPPKRVSASVTWIDDKPFNKWPNRFTKRVLLAPKQVGARVTLNTLLRAGDFAGEVIAINEISGTCTVKLDTQDTPVTGVLWFDERPEVVPSTRWQICYPQENENENTV